MWTDADEEERDEAGTADDVEVVEPEVIDPDTDEESDGSAGLMTPDQLDPFGDSSDEEPRSLPVHLSLVPRHLDVDSLVLGDPLSLYLAHLKHLEPLPAEQQQELAERYHEHEDVEAAKLLILSNVRLVVKIAREYRRRRESLMELIQEGNVGLAEAIRRYDPYRGVKFTSYAQYWIRAMILNYLMNVGQSLKIGSTRAGRKLFFNLNREREKLLQETRTQPSTRLLADRLGVSEKEVVNVMRVLDGTPLSIDAPLPGYEKTPLGALLKDEEGTTPEQEVVQANIREKLKEALEEFAATITDAREQRIWSDRVLSDEPKSLQELGDEFQISRERVRQIEVKIKERAAGFMRKRFGQEELKLVLSG